MAHRDVSVAICGAVVGVILGAGSLAFSQDVTLQGSVTQDVIQSRRASVQTYRQRNVYERYEDGQLEIHKPDRSGAPTVKPDETSSSSASSPAQELTICSAVREVLSTVGEAHDQFIPVNITNTAMRRGLDAVLESLRTDARYCQPEDAVEASQSDEQAAVKTVNNRCDTIAKKGTVRYTICKIFETQGKKYP